MPASSSRFLALIAVLALGACANEGEGPSHGGAARVANSSSDDAARIQRDCEARGGQIAPTGRITNEPALDNPCRYPAGATPPERK